jgi:asparagine synthase (glutamine-hydrolysing)
MCGIAGIVGRPVKSEQLEAMANAMVRRGPDDEGFHRGAEIGLAFRRLAIVDLASGRQPMPNEDGSVQVVFNGEIYDHHLLRRELESRGHRFATDHSDTEVLVHGWEEWAERLFPKLNGMFGTAIWDERTRTLVLARDRYGIKPLYYAPLPGGGLAFASEIKAILASELIAPQPSEDGLIEYFTLQNLVQRNTMFRGVFQLPAGTLLIWQNHRIRSRIFWDIRFPRSRRQTEAELAEEHRAILMRSVKRQIAADVPVKSYLSGGIDSTALTVTAHLLNPNVTAYSCIFELDGVGHDRTVDEREFSRLVAAEKNIDRAEVELPADCLTSLLDDYVGAVEDLRMGMGYPIFRMAQRVGQDAKVVLSGTGGDEFHAGYVGRFQCLQAEALPNRSWLGLRGRVRAWMRTLGESPAKRRPRFFPNAAAEAQYRRMLNFPVPWMRREQVFQPDFLRRTSGFDFETVVTDLLERCPSEDWRDRVLYVDAKGYLAGLLVLEDKLSMHHSLETRVPLLDNELVDFVLDVPFETLWRGDVGKKLFRESVRPLVPDAIYRKPKMGFGPPDASWYRGKLRPWIEDQLLGPEARWPAILQPRFVRTLLHEHFVGQSDRTYWIWSLLNFETWCRVFGLYGAAPDSLGGTARINETAGARAA